MDFWQREKEDERKGLAERNKEKARQTASDSTDQGASDKEIEREKQGSRRFCGNKEEESIKE